MLSQYNPVKVSLLVYRVSWLIERKRIYSLITKCQILNNYVLDSLIRYLETFNNVAQLYKFMKEPVLSLDAQKDSLDIMLEMNLDKVLNHPVIVEVLNLAYEGQYSVDSSVVDLSTTFTTFFQMGTFDLKPVRSRLLANIKNFGLAKGDRRQSSLMFNIWKHCLEQRIMDEVIFTVGICLFFFYEIHSLMSITTGYKGFMEFVFGSEFVTQIHYFVNADEDTHAFFCTGLD
mmetsp:Transcript_12403/g.19381  ORF Transcript_12403/g.19381 Transcript_12403/m.19381 type:complete len:231 (+) Transcript_12403:1572-2264(+)